jgi:hypothetical protein
MPNGIAVTSRTPRYSKPEKTWPKAGSGTEKPKFEKAAVTFAPLMPPTLRPNKLEPQAITTPAAMATRPAGIPLGYFTPPNQLTMMMAKHVRPMTGVMNISSAGRMEMKAIDTPASVPKRAARGVILRM